MSRLKSEGVVFLLGAGASVEARIPHSKQMIEDIERKILGNAGGWGRFKDLYNCIQRGIIFSEGIKGRFSSSTNYNIEMLVDTIDEIGKLEHHTLYPFILKWDPHLHKIISTNPHLVGEFRQRIVDVLRYEWLVVQNYERDAGYYNGLLSFQKDYQHSLPVFSLNYDLCLERCVQSREDISLERGFDDRGVWDWRQFEEFHLEHKDIYLYKLHGSVDWTYDEDGQLIHHDQVYQSSELAVIFGRTYKLEYRDPFLFLTYEFRRRTLTSQMIVVIGYGFGDEHINLIIQQALKNHESRVLLVVSPLADQSEDDRLRTIGHAIGHSNLEQIRVCGISAKKFMTEHLTVKSLEKYLPIADNQDIPF